MENAYLASIDFICFFFRLCWHFLSLFYFPRIVLIWMDIFNQQSSRFQSNLVFVTPNPKCRTFYSALSYFTCFRLFFVIHFALSKLVSLRIGYGFLFWGWQATKNAIFWCMKLKYHKFSLSWNLTIYFWTTFFPKMNCVVQIKYFWLYSNLSTSSLRCTSCLLCRKGWKVNLVIVTVLENYLLFLSVRKQLFFKSLCCLKRVFLQESSCRPFCRAALLHFEKKLCSTTKCVYFDV